MSERLELKAGDTRLILRPDYGGRIARLSFGDWDVLRPIPDNATDVWNGYKGGSFPLVPFSNRIKDAKFSFNGTNVSIDQHPNEGRHALHGHGCFSNWPVVHKDANSAEIAYQHEAGQAGWPWSYRASQRFEVSNNECQVTISVTNTSDNQMPLGIGFHPFFPFDGDVNLRFNADTEWVGSPEIFPTERRPLTHNFHLEQGERLWRDTKTVCFDGFRREAEIHWAHSNRRLRLTSDKLLNHFIVHVPEGANYFCLEPVCHPTDGFNLAAQNVEGVDVLTLDTGQTQSTSMALRKI